MVANNADGTETADKLGLAIDAAQKTVDGGSLHLQTVHEGTLLSTLNRGKGVQLGSIMITDTTGSSSGVNLLTSDAQTVGDVLDLINGAGLAVEARINDTGDGIVLIDTAGGSGTLQVTEGGSRTAAADLQILGTSTEVDINGTPTQVIDGAQTRQLDIVQTIPARRHGQDQSSGYGSDGQHSQYGWRSDTVPHRADERCIGLSR